MLLRPLQSLLISHFCFRVFTTERAWSTTSRPGGVTDGRLLTIQPKYDQGYVARTVQRGGKGSGLIPPYASALQT